MTVKQLIMTHTDEYCQSWLILEVFVPELYQNATINHIMVKVRYIKSLLPLQLGLSCGHICHFGSCRQDLS